MSSQSLLIFALDGVRFGVDVAQVSETVWLPELTPIEESPLWVIGLFSLRSKIVPVIDLHLRFGHQQQPYSPDNQIVLMATEKLLIGLIVSEVMQVVEIPLDAIQPIPQFDNPHSGLEHLLLGVVRVDEDLVAVLDVSCLAHQLDGEMPIEATKRSSAAGYFCPSATQEDRTLFHARALMLQQSSVEEEAKLGLAVLELGGEYFGIELTAVEEFCEISQLSPIPCCPPHILGVMSLRGNLLTLLDPRSAFNLPQSSKVSKAVITRFGEQLLGMAVDEIHDIVYLRREELQPPPTALQQQTGAEIIGTVQYGERVMTILNLQMLLARQQWVVNENV